MDYTALVATIQAIMAAISAWQAERNYRLARQTYEQTFERVRTDPQTELMAQRLRGVLPPQVAQTFRSNLDNCWATFNKCIKGTTEEHEFLECEDANRGCICSNLRSLVRNSGCLPQDLKDLWIQFSCGPVPPIC